MPSTLSETDASPAKHAAPYSTLPFDAAKYETHLKDMDLSEQQRAEVLQVLWSIMSAFVDLGFGVDSVRLALPQPEYVVIFDDLKRFARDTIFHLKLRQDLAAYNATVECLNFKFEDTPEGEFVETVCAAQGQLERKQNRRQTLQKMKARVERGYYVFATPIGYRYKKVDGHGRILVRDEPLATIIEAPDCGVTLRKGHHEPLISFATYRTIQDRLSGNAKTPARKNLDADFPLRGAVACGHCDTPLTACWAKAKYSRYPYYFCPKRGCTSYGKSIRRETIEGQFEGILNQLQPSPALFSAARAMFQDIWNHRLETAEARRSNLKDELSKIERDVEQFLDRIAKTTVPSVASAYENRIRTLEEQKVVITEQIANSGRPLRSFDETLRTSLDFLENPWNLWVSEHLNHKRAVLKLAFADRLSYVRNEGFRTPCLALPFKVLADFKRCKSRMARPRGQSSNSLLQMIAEWGDYLNRLAGAVGQAIGKSTRSNFAHTPALIP